MVNIVNKKASILADLQAELEKEIDYMISKQLEYNAKGESTFKEYVEVKVDYKYQQVSSDVLHKYTIYGYEVTKFLTTQENIIRGGSLVPVDISWYKIDWSDMPI